MTTEAVKRVARKARIQSPEEDDGFKWSWSWKSLAAVVYLLICFADFLGMPMYREYIYTKMSVPEMVRLAQEMSDGAAQIEALQILKADRAWVPITNDMFHLSFGAILGVAAFPTARDRIRRRRRRSYGNDFEYADSYNDMGGDDYGAGDDYGVGENDYGPDLPTPRGR